MSRLGDDEERVAIGIEQAKLRWYAGERRAAPPHHLALSQRVLVHVEPLGAEGGKVGEDIGAEEHDARLDA